MSGLNHQEDNRVMEHRSSPFVSVIVPVYNDARRLRICLEALENQKYPKSLYEIIVVDNASDEAEDIKGVVAQFSQAFVRSALANWVKPTEKIIGEVKNTYQFCCLT